MTHGREILNSIKSFINKHMDNTKEAKKCKKESGIRCSKLSHELNQCCLKENKQLMLNIVVKE